MEKERVEYSKEIDEYINKFPEEVKKKLNEIRSIIHKVAPEVTEKISYQMPTFYYKENLVHFAAYKNHIGFYPAPSGITAFKGRIQEYKWAKGSVQFPLSKDIPYDLISDITEFRYREVQQKYKLF